MNGKITTEQISAIISRALAEKILHPEDTTITFYDLSLLKQKIEELNTLFPVDSLHAVSIKANPLPKILQYLQPLNVGAEAATLGELYLAQKSGYANSKIVFDSPAKTIPEIEYALKAGVHINSDSLAELKRIIKLAEENPPAANIGIRINPQIGSGSISTTSVAERNSKFGVPLDDYADEINSFFSKYDWLNCIHFHVGSQGNSLEQLVAASQKILSFIDKMERKPQYIDIGGGLPVRYTDRDNYISMKEYVNRLNKSCPQLFNGEFKLITEFGRYIHANCGWTASRVEYLKSSAGINTAIIHVGADQFLRASYQPQFWQHDISVLDDKGEIKQNSQKLRYTIAGPLCFAGDVIARDVELPVVEQGDFIIIHDSGAYTLSMWSRYNSRPMPKVLGYQNNGAQFDVLKNRETLEDVYNFWL
jgi:diaminopimelate decarboxylase